MFTGTFKQMGPQWQALQRRSMTATAVNVLVNAVGLRYFFGMKILSMTLLAGVMLTGTLLGAQAKTITLPVYHVVDGDSIWLRQGKKILQIRLVGIDSPEQKQPFGEQATAFTSRLIQGKTVTVKTHGVDVYRRILGTVILANGKNLNHEMLRAGMAWRSELGEGTALLKQLEAEARKAKRGLWAQAKPVEPWIWRRQARRKPPTTKPKPKTKPAPAKPQIYIAAVLPNPKGRDAGNEQVILFNPGKEPVNLRGWVLRDKAGHTHRLSGTAPKGGIIKVTLPKGQLPLNNNGDTVQVLDPAGKVRHEVKYTAQTVQPGKLLTFRLQVPGYERINLR